jgi:hypothetical protein
MYSRPARAAWRLHFCASPVFFVIAIAVGRNRFSAANIGCASPTDPAVGLKMMYGFILRQRISKSTVDLRTRRATFRFSFPQFSANLGHKRYA